jgi:hypothetical protein
MVFPIPTYPTPTPMINSAIPRIFYYVRFLKSQQLFYNQKIVEILPHQHFTTFTNPVFTTSVSRVSSNLPLPSLRPITYKNKIKTFYKIYK